MNKQIPPLEFNTIFNKIELGSSIERLQDVMDILWAAEESLLEDDLVEICRISGNEWRNICNSFVKNWLLDSGRLGFINSAVPLVNLFD